MDNFYLMAEDNILSVYVTWVLSFMGVMIIT